MEQPRVKAGIWVAAALRMGTVAGQPGVVERRGDADAGGILVKLRGRAGFAVLSQVRTGDGEPAWMRATGPAPVPEPEADAYITRQISRDPDLWVLEFETPDLQPPFEARMV